MLLQDYYFCFIIYLLLLDIIGHKIVTCGFRQGYTQLYNYLGYMKFIALPGGSKKLWNI